MRGVRVDEGPVHPDDPLPGAESGSVADTPSIHGSNEVTAILLRVEIEAEFFGRCRLFLEFREIRRGGETDQDTNYGKGMVHFVVGRRRSNEDGIRWLKMKHLDGDTVLLEFSNIHIFMATIRLSNKTCQ